MAVSDGVWIEPETQQTYPTAYLAYRRRREAQERPPARHQRLGFEVDRYAWRWWQARTPASTDVRLMFRDGTSPRIQRMVAEILRGIRRGQAANEAIRRVSRRFGLRQTRTRAFISACLRFEVHPREDQIPGVFDGPRAPVSCLGDIRC